MATRHLVFIINPHSGTDRVKALTGLIDTTLDKTKYTCEIQHTAHAGHGTQLARTAAQNGAWGVVAIGGDGSVNDVLAGLLGTDTVLGIIPKGSGNGAARTLGIPLKPAAAIEVINRGNVAKLDAGLANDKPFLSNAGVAFDALISHLFRSSKRRGLAIYSWLVTKHLWTYRSAAWNITIDGQAMQERAFIISVANGSQFGYGFQIAPTASLTDGLFDVVVIRDFPRVLGTGLVLRALRGSILSSRYVSHYRGAEVVVSHPSLNIMQVDGDAHPASGEVRFTMLPRAVKVLVP